MTTNIPKKSGHGLKTIAANSTEVNAMALPYGAAEPRPDVDRIAPSPTATTPPSLRAPRQTKSARLRAMLAEPEGASLTRIMTETGWQAHTVRAALTGIRKSGVDLLRERIGKETFYRIVTAASEAGA